MERSNFESVEHCPPRLFEFTSSVLLAEISRDGANIRTRVDSGLIKVSTHNSEDFCRTTHERMHHFDQLRNGGHGAPPLRPFSLDDPPGVKYILALVNAHHVGRAPFGLEAGPAKWGNFGHFTEVILQPFGEWLVEVGFPVLGPCRCSLFEASDND